MLMKEILKRDRNLRSKMEEEGICAFLIADNINQLYLTNFIGASLLLVPNEGESVLYVPSVNYEDAKENALNCKVTLLEGGRSFISVTAEFVKNSGIENLAFDRLEASQYRILTSKLGDVSLVPKKEIISEMRAVKDEYEIACMRRAAEITKAGFEAAVETVKPGVTEIEVAAEMEYAMRKEGSHGVAFDTIVASGKRSAFPHGGCRNKKIVKGDLVVLDFGVKFENYMSDITRTLVVGNPTNKQREVYEVVRAAQEKAFKIMRSGIKGCDVDRVARKIIEEAGYGENFVHGLGHGVGLEIHEPPTLNQRNTDPLRNGNVVTDEPGVYIVNFGGVRIEDTVLIREGGAEKLTTAPYTFSV